VNVTESYAAAVAAFVALVRRLPDDRWSDPGLGVWDLRALVGHASRSLVTVDTYLDRPAEHEDLASPEAYYIAAVALAGADPAAVAERGRQAGAAMGPDPAGFVDTLARRVLDRVATAGDPVIETICGGMRLQCYLPTRTFELVVHSLDITAATGVEAGLSEELLAEAAGLAVRVGVVRGQGTAMLLALTGRTALPSGFSVL
jgi:uncharacterized protein (TIGR03083 family)